MLLTDCSIGDKIRVYRSLIRLSQADLASMLFVDQSVISRWERGNRKPSADTIERLAIALQTDIENLK